jgi:ABC-type xylose transport system permease subunit
VKFMVTGVVLLVAVVLDAISRSRTGTGNAR